MSVKLYCRLCCTPGINEYQYLQNDSGECNEIYEMTVKYFDPMLLVDENTTYSEKSSVLCQNCWEHIKDFHNFQQTVLKTRSSLEQNNFGVNDTDKEELVLNKLLENDFKDGDCSEGNYDLSTDCDDDKPLNALKRNNMSEQSNISNDNKIHGKETNSLEKARYRRSKRTKNQWSTKKDKNSQRKRKSLKDSSKNDGLHPVLDKGREYDQFIAEWKSQLECDICGESFPIFELLKVHFKAKHSVRCFVKCCDRKFDRRCSLVEHIRLHINPEMHKCDICGKLSGSKYSLIHHKRTIHEESQKFRCNKCPKIFKQKQNLKCHLLTHVTGNRDFKCTECDKAYVLELQLKKHVKLVHIDTRICDQCGKTLHGIGALKNHLKEHDRIEKPKYPCDDCGAQLGSRITLKRHKASYHNDGSTVYICSLCGKASSTERALKNHKKYVHEIERKYKCPHCDKGFKRSQNLQEHIATHTGEALYQCQQCPRSFKINSKYHEHRKKAHPIEWEAGRKNRIEKQKIDYERVTNQVIL